MKRTRDQITARNAAAYRRKRQRTLARQVGILPARSYPGSMVPLASRGYRPNPIEKKCLDISGTMTLDLNGEVDLLFNPIIGADMDNRVGRKTTLKSIQIRAKVAPLQAQVLPTGAGNFPASIVRLVLVWDSQPNGVLATASDILRVNNPLANLNINNRDRFKVLWDKNFTFDPFSNAPTTFQYTGCGKVSTVFKKYKKVNLETIFSTSLGTIADIRSGALLLLGLGDQTNGTNRVAAMTYECRCRYLDM